MAQDLSSRIPTIIALGLVNYLPTRPALLGKVYTRRVPETALGGGKTVKIHKPAAIFTPTDVSYSSAPAAQEIATPSVDLTMNVHKEVVISMDELEDRYSQGGKEGILMDTVPAIVNGLIREFDKSLTALYSGFVNTVGAYNAHITDANLREAARLLSANGVDTETPGNVHFMTDTVGYFTDLLGIDKYVLPLNVGQVQNPSSIVTGSIPTLFGMTVGSSQHIQSTTVSGNTVAHSLLFEKYAFAIGFTEFNPANAANIKESIITDKATGVTIRMQESYDAGTRKRLMKFDIRGGVAILDTARFVRYQHQIA